MGGTFPHQLGSRWPCVIEYGNWLFKYRNVVFPAVILGLFVAFTPVLAPDKPFVLPLLDMLDLVGLSLALAGQSLRAAVIGLAYIKRGGLNKKVYAERLVTGGLFAHSRNPLYVGNLLILSGVFIIHNNPWVMSLGALFFITAYGAIVAAEEAYLLQKFGNEYREYCARVNRWLPKLQGLAHTVHAMTFNWRRVLLKDYASCFTWLMVALALEGYEMLERFGMHHPHHRVHTILAVAVLATIIFALLRYLKKTRNLREVVML